MLQQMLEIKALEIQLDFSTTHTLFHVYDAGQENSEV